MLKTTPFSPLFTFVFACTLVYGCSNPPANNTTNNTTVSAHYGSPDLDGSGSEEAWDRSEWQPITTLAGGTQPDSNDFQGRYKVLWDDNMLYILAEIKDDTLVDINPDGLKKYTDDDCLVLILDEDGSGGDHTYNYNAFAYHIALDSKVVDIAPDSSIRFYDDHCISQRSTKDNMSVWEIGLKVFDGNAYTDEGENIAKSLKAGKKLGFAIGYYDNDRAAEHEHFLTSTPLGNKNNPEQNASSLNILELVRQE